MDALSTQFQNEVDRSVRRIEEGLAPYVQFVEGERQTLTERRQVFADLQARLTALRSEIDARPGGPPPMPPP
jgi:hypothetical protein